MPFWSKKKRKMLPDKLDFVGIDHAYGLHADKPIMCGFGVEGEMDYLKRLRCPSGEPIQFERTGSIGRTSTDYLNDADVKLSVSAGTQRRLGEDFDPQGLPLDRYRFICECGNHSGELFIDMYFRGPELPIAEPGWKLTGPGASFDKQIANCPYCNEELRTNLAKQCRFCKMDWHDPENVHRRT